LREYKLTSDIIRTANPGFEAERQFAVYLPPNYDPKAQPYDLLLFFDGGGCRNIASDMPIPTILNNLTADRTIRPAVAVFIYQTNERLLELGCSQPFCDFVADELIPWIRKRCNAKLMEAIVGFEIPIAKIEGKFKLGQYRSQDDRNSLAANLSAGSDEECALAEFIRHWMS